MTKSPSVQIIVYEYVSSRLRERGFNGWNPSSDITSNASLTQVQRDRVQASLKRLSDELISLSGDQIQEMSDRLASALPFQSIDYSAFETTAAELFADGIRWSHILTLLVFASELAYSQGVTTGSNEFINNVADWCTRYISSPALLSWINDHGGWEGLVAYESERNNDNEDGNNGGPGLGHDTSSNALIGLGGAISMVLAGITYLVARH